jgi:hypothetical protein
MPSTSPSWTFSRKESRLIKCRRDLRKELVPSGPKTLRPCAVSVGKGGKSCVELLLLRTLAAAAAFAFSMVAF